MSLTSAHEGYEYQDLITAYFILKDLVAGVLGEFTIDKKITDDIDLFDDLTISRMDCLERKQFKYSNSTTNKKLIKKDLSSAGGYEITLDLLFKSWLNTTRTGPCDFRLCLAWDEPDDEVVEILLPDHQCRKSFDDGLTSIFRIDVEKLWPENSEPISSWIRFRRESKKIDRDQFIAFCHDFSIELNCPKASFDLYVPNSLERYVLNLVKKLGVGIYPNEHKNLVDVTLNLLSAVKKARSSAATLSTRDLLQKIQLRTDFGHINQDFEINNVTNVRIPRIYDEYIKFLESNNKIILVGEPGSGKSWLINNLIEYLTAADCYCARHFCFISPDDQMQVGRIKSNTFYGNLISDILDYFPFLKSHKQTLYGADLNELNNLIKNIDETLYIFIDGLDHIQRIYSSYSQFVTSAEIQIIEDIMQIEIPPNIKFIVASQPIPEVEDLQKKGFTIVDNQPWTQEEINYLLEANSLEDRTISEQLTISQWIHGKSNGNPLYVNYLIRTIQNLDYISEEILSEIPSYDGSLSTYYTYLINKLESNRIACIFSGLAFAVTEAELKEISGLGNLVTNDLKFLTPVLKENSSTGGITIYHESFRRFILEQLTIQEVDIKRVVFQDTISWLFNKGFYDYPKSYRNLVELLLQTDQYSEIKNLIVPSYLSESLIHGYNKSNIVRNFQFFLKAATTTQDWPKIILLAEINRNIYSFYFDDSLKYNFELMCNAIGYCNGFEAVTEMILVEGNPTYSEELGLNACYLCDQQGVLPPWEEYLDLLNEGVKLDYYRYYVRGIYRLNGIEDIEAMAEQLDPEKYSPFIDVFIKEYIDLFGSEQMSQLVAELQNNKPYWETKYNEYILGNSELISSSVAAIKEDFHSLCNEILNFTYISEESIPKIHKFITYIEYLSTRCPQAIESELLSFNSQNWFYNWLVFISEYYLTKSKIKNQKLNPIQIENEIVTIYQFLASDVDCFKGTPRTCDLYYCEDLIYETIKEPLGFLEDESNWEEIISSLFIISSETTTYLQGSTTGPLTPDRLLRIFSEIINETNKNAIVSMTFTILSRSYTYYSYNTVNNFYAAIIYSKANLFEEAKNAMRKAFQNMCAYTDRKDRTFSELIDSVLSVVKRNPLNATDIIKRLKSLCDAVVAHTDGKETKWYPIQWFEKFFNIDLDAALSYLLNQLIKYPYHWKLEDSLIDISRFLLGIIPADIIANIYLSFPIERSFDYIEGFIATIHTLNNDGNESLAYRCTCDLYNRLSGNQVFEINDSLLPQINALCIKFGLKPIEKHKPSNLDRSNKIKKFWWESIEDRPSIGDMEIFEAANYFKDGITQRKINPLIYFLEQNDDLTPDLKVFFKEISRRPNSIVEEHYKNLSIALDSAHCLSPIMAFAHICQFTSQSDGWLHYFVNKQALKKAVSYDSNLAFTALSDRIYEILREPHYPSLFVANLINAFESIDVDPILIMTMFESAFSIIDYRLPEHDTLDWDELLIDNYDMTTEEKVISIMFSRLKSPTVERQHRAFAAINYLFRYHPDNVIKPTKWFLKNSKSFLDLTVISFLQILVNYSAQNPEYIIYLEPELSSMLLNSSFPIKYLISEILNIEVDFNMESVDDEEISLHASTEDIDFLVYSHENLQSLLPYGLDVKRIANIFYSKIRDKEFRKEIGELLYNRMDCLLIPNIYFDDVLIETLNGDILRLIGLSCLSPEIFPEIMYLLCVDLETLIAYQNSISTRPIIPLPSELDDTVIDIDISGDWITLAHYEEQFISNHKKSHTIRVLMTPVLDRRSVTPDILYFLMGDFFIGGKHSAMPIIEGRIKYHGFERMFLLWLPENLFNLLSLEMDDFNNGIIAKDRNDQIVLKLIQWETDYLGYERLDQEMPKLKGSQLILRKDLFQELCKFTNSVPKIRVETFKI
jgi:hypothetical protein